MDNQSLTRTLSVPLHYPEDDQFSSTLTSVDPPLDSDESKKTSERNIRFADHRKHHRNQPSSQYSRHQRSPSAEETSFPSRNPIYIHSHSSDATIPVNHVESPTEKEREAEDRKWYHSYFLQPIDKFLKNNSNRSALQVAVGFTLGSLFVIVEPINNALSNTVWVSFTIVMILDNTIGGFLDLSGQRILGTLAGGLLAMTGMTLTRLIFSTWGIGANILLSTWLFVQVFWIAKFKSRPRLNSAGNIGLLTTAVISLSGYYGLRHDKISSTVELAAWRILSVILGIVIAMIMALCVFPVQASRQMRNNIGEALEETADLLERTADYYLNLKSATQQISQQSIHSTPTCIHHTENQEGEEVKYGETSNCQRANGSRPASVANVVSRNYSPRKRSPLGVDSDGKDGEIEEDRQTAPSSQTTVLNDAPTFINELCDKALEVLKKLQNEGKRVQNVSNEYYLQLPLHLFRGHRERCRRDMQRAARYAEAIDAMKRLAWPIVSYRLLFPLVRLSVSSPDVPQQQQLPDQQQQQQQSNLPNLHNFHFHFHRQQPRQQPRQQHNSSAILLNHGVFSPPSTSPTDTGSFPTLPDTMTMVQQRIVPTQPTLESFEDSLRVMRRLGGMLKDQDRKLSEHPDWYHLERTVVKGQSHIQQELAQLVQLSANDASVDGLKLLSYYGFLVRCSMIWEGLMAVVDKLGPQWHSRRSSTATLNTAEPTILDFLKR